MASCKLIVLPRYSYIPRWHQKDKCYNSGSIPDDATHNPSPQLNEQIKGGRQTTMKTIEEVNTTHLLIIILGATAIIGEIGTILLIYQQNLDIAVITGLLTFTGNITGGLIGYLGANNNNDEIISDDTTSDTEDIEDTTTNIPDVEVTQDVQHTQNNTDTIPEKQ